jgi:hypothetical protein
MSGKLVLRGVRKRLIFAGGGDMLGGQQAFTEKVFQS